MKQSESIELCSADCTHPEAVKKAMNGIPCDDRVNLLTDLYKSLGDSTRVKILFALTFGELCVCDIAAALSMTQSAISHQLRVLKASRLVKFRRDGKTVYYSMDDHHIEKIFSAGFAHINE